MTAPPQQIEPVAPIPPATTDTNPTAEQIRKEIRAVLDHAPFGVAELHRVETIAKAGRGLLQAGFSVECARLRLLVHNLHPGVLIPDEHAQFVIFRINGQKREAVPA